MGYMITAKCNNCKTSKDLLLGIGMLYDTDSIYFRNNGSMLYEIVEDDRIVDEAMTLLNTEKGVPGEYNTDVYICPECKDIEQKFYFQIAENESNGDNNILYEPNYSCVKCKVPLKHIHFNWGEEAPDLEGKLKLEGWLCNECGSSDMSCEETGLWD